MRHLITAIMAMLLAFINVNAQIELNPVTYEDDLITYLTAFQAEAKKTMVLAKKDQQFIEQYQYLVAEYNGFINAYITQLILMKPKAALGDFREKNQYQWVQNSDELKKIYNAYDILMSNQQKGLTEVTAVAGVLISIGDTVIGLLNEAHSRRDAQRTNIIKMLESLKLEPVELKK